MPSLVAPAVVRGSLAASPQPVIDVGDGLILRPWSIDDVDGLCEAYRDPSIQRWHARTMTPDEARQWIKQTHERWASEAGAGWALSDGSALVGRLGLGSLNHQDGDAGLGYWTVPQARGHGLAPRALEAISRWAFEVVGLHRLFLEHSTRNEPSCRVAHKANFSLEGSLRGRARHEDGWHDMHVHGRLRSD